MNVMNRQRRIRRPEPTPTRTPRQRLVGGTAAGRAGTTAAKDTRHVEALVAAHMHAVEAAESAAIRVKDTYVELEKAMKEAGLTECRAGDWQAAYVSSKPRQSNTIDPAGFYKLCKDKDDFFSAVTVVAAEAKRLLPEKALENITTKTMGHAGPPTLKVGKAK